MRPPISDLERDLVRLEGDLKRLEAEYNAFFAGRLPKPPWETRNRVESMVKKIDRQRMQNTALRFRFLTMQSRFMTFADLWDRGQRAREEGRPGPFVQPKAGERESRPVELQVLYVAAFHDPGHEMEKLEDLYESLSVARREIGDPPVPFHKFAALVKTQVGKMQAAGSPEVAFRVALKDGKVNFTARAMKSMTPQGPSRPEDEAD